MVQLKPCETISESTDPSVKLVEEAAKSGVDVICLPESWVLTNPYLHVERLCEHSEEILAKMMEIAREYGTYIIPGALYEKEGDGYYVTSPVVGRRGEILGRQSKVHLFEEEKRLFQPGRDYRVFSLGEYRVGIMICYDMAFPEVARILTLKGAEVIFNPSRIKRGGVEPWHIYLKARCLENRVPIVGVNIAHPPTHPGKSLVLQAFIKRETRVVYPKVLALSGEIPGVTSAQIDVKSVEEVRRERLKDRMPKTYSPILSEFIP